MKKIICVFCALLMVACLVPFSFALSADSDFVIEDGVLTAYTGSATSVAVPSAAYSIADGAFANNTTIKSVTLHSKLYSIGDKAFYGCTSLKTVKSASSVKYVGALAFTDTLFLNESTDEFLVLGSALISYNGTSTAVTLPDSIETIAPYAFLRNTKIKSFSANSNLTSISEGAFYDCTALSTLLIPKSVNFIGADAFKNTKFLLSKTGYVVLGDGVLVAYNGSDTAVMIPSTVKYVAANAFYQNSTITSVKFADSVISIGARAFMSCSKLASVDFNSDIVMIDDEAFANCTKLVEIETPKMLNKLGKGAFINCTKLKIARVRGNELTLDYGVFANCTALEAVLLSSDVVAVGDCAFINNSVLKAVTIPDSVMYLPSNVITPQSLVTIICDDNSFAHSALSSSFATTNLRGECRLDGTIDIMDATTVQKYIASLITLTCEQLAFADADLDACITVLDATYIQRYLAKLL